MGGIFNSCTQTKHLNAAAVGAGGVAGQLSDIDSAALAAIQNGINGNQKAALK